MTGFRMFNEGFKMRVFHEVLSGELTIKVQTLKACLLAQCRLVKGLTSLRA